MDIPNELKEKLFEKYFLPCILNPQNLQLDEVNWFREKSRLARILNFNKEDFQKINTVYNILIELHNNEIDLKGFLNSYFDRYVIENEKIEYPQFDEEEKSNYTIFGQKLNNMYKSYFETGLRFYFSIFYLYGKSKDGEISKIIDLLSISASTKFHYIKKHLDKDIPYNIITFLEGFDNNLRNQGGGHEQYFIDDNKNIVYTKTNDESGKEKKVYTVSIENLSKILKSIHRNFLIIDIAIALFKVNTGIIIGGDRNTPFLQREIKGRIEKQSTVFGMDVKIDFLSNGDVEIYVKEYEAKFPISSRISEMWLDNRHYYLIPMVSNIERKKGLCWLIDNVGKFYTEDTMPNQIIHIQTKKDSEPISIKVSKDEVLKMILLPDRQNYLPSLVEGTYPDGSYQLRYNEKIEDDGSFSREQLEEAYKRTF